MNHFIYCFGLLGAIACSGRTVGTDRSLPVTPPVYRPVPAALAESGIAHAPPPDSQQSGSDRVFIENAERAIREYSEFIARAGQDEAYAPAVKRSREQIEDLQAALIFVRAGAREHEQR